MEFILFLALLFTIPIFILALVYLSGCADPMIRQINLCKEDSSSFIKNYCKLNKCTKDKVVISLTSTRQNMGELRKTLNSLMDQTTRVDQISLNLPKKYEYDIPSDYSNMCNIFPIGKDYGEGNNIIPALQRETDRNTKILILDGDGTIYDKDFVEHLVMESDKYPDSYIKSEDGLLIKPSFVQRIDRDNCTIEWLEQNMTASKVTV